MRIFLAQESKVVGNMLRQALRSSPWSSATTTDVCRGADLLNWLEAESDPETLVILDWNLPGFDVPTFLTSSADSGVLSRVSLLVCVSSSDLPVARMVLPRKGAEFIARPFSDEELCEKIGGLMRSMPQPSPVAAADVLQEIYADARAQEHLPSLLSLPSAVIARMFEGCPPLRHAPGTELLSPGQRLEGLPFVTSGEVEIDGPGGCFVRGAGECFGERAFVCGEPAQWLVRALTPVEIILIPKESLVQLARRHPVVQRFLQSLLLQPLGVGTKAEKPQLSGALSSLGFADLIQFLHAGRKTGLLTLDDGEMHGRIYFEDGQVSDASVGGEIGKDAFFELARRTRSRFAFHGGVLTVRRLIDVPTLKLLMESLLPAEAGNALTSDPITVYCTQAG
jgi:CheY-like chemotaxis protein